MLNIGRFLRLFPEAMYMSSKKVKVGIAGLGRSGWGIHAGLLEPMSRKYSVSGVFDRDRERMKEAEERFGCRTHASLRSLINQQDIDLMVVATPNKLHAGHSIE